MAIPESTGVAVSPDGASGVDRGVPVTSEEIPLAAEDKASDSVASDLRSAFSRSVEKLAKRQKIVFVMRHYNELQFNEISEAMRISVGTAKSLHFKAVRNLRKWLTPDLGMQR